MPTHKWAARGPVPDPRAPPHKARDCSLTRNPGSYWTASPEPIWLWAAATAPSPLQERLPCLPEPTKWTCTYSEWQLGHWLQHVASHHRFSKERLRSVCQWKSSISENGLCACFTSVPHEGAIFPFVSLETNRHTAAGLQSCLQSEAPHKPTCSSPRSGLEEQKPTPSLVVCTHFCFCCDGPASLSD